LATAAEDSRHSDELKGSCIREIYRPKRRCGA
jgi:hypothetical protein